MLSANQGHVIAPGVHCHDALSARNEPVERRSEMREYPFFFLLHACAMRCDSSGLMDVAHVKMINSGRAAKSRRRRSAKENSK